MAILTHPSPLRPVRVFPVSQRWWDWDRGDFSPAPQDGAGMGLDFLDPPRPILTPSLLDPAQR